MDQNLSYKCVQVPNAIISSLGRISSLYSYISLGELGFNWRPQGVTNVWCLDWLLQATGIRCSVGVKKNHNLMDNTYKGCVMCAWDECVCVCMRDARRALMDP